MTTSPEPDLPPEWVSDEVFRDAKPIGDRADWALPGFFANDAEFEEFQAWLKAERASGTA